MLELFLLVESLWSTRPVYTMAEDAPAAASRPQKPDEAAFKQSLAQVDKEHKQIMDQYVRCNP